ncbi:MAG: PEGA domain-containing protein, partial [Gemmatimonadota bacterium]
MRSFRRSFTLVVAMLVSSGLAPETSAAQEWHELYAGGKQALRNGQAERAVQLLRSAIQKRPQPGVTVPTYGTNFEPQYFPYLRLAEAYLRLEAYEEVLKVMETSARFGVEPAAERAALETRARSALDAKRVAAQPVQAPPPTSAAAPPIPQPKSTVPNTTAATPKREPEVTPAETTRSMAPELTPRGNVASRPRQPVLDLTTQPAGALVFVDDEPVGRSDPQTGRLRLATLREGRHRLRISADGHDDLVREIVLASDPLAFHGVLSVSRTATDTKERPSAPATPVSPRTLWWFVLIP